MEGPETQFGLNTDMAELYIGNNKISSTGETDVYLTPSYGQSIDDSFIESSGILNGLDKLGDLCLAATNITSIVIPDTVKTLGMGCFMECKQLTSISIPSSVTTIGEGCFCNNDSLKSLLLPDSVTSIGRQLCTNDRGLETVTLSNNLSALPDYTFNCCYRLKSITIPASITYIGGHCFSTCLALETIYFEGDPPTLDNTASNDPYRFGELKKDATLYYKANNNKWTEAIKTEYLSKIGSEGAHFETY